jgi:NAD(P)H dehydrogenase (quinone)
MPGKTRGSAPLVRIFSVLAHPESGSFTRALLDACLEAAASAGHVADRADLYRDGFDPRFLSGEFAQFGDGFEPSPQIAAYQQRMRQADAWVFAFPIWWWSMPAIMKGWIDRVFTRGFAYQDGSDGATGLLRDRPVLLLTPCSVGDSTIAKYRYDDAFRQATGAGVFGYCGIRDVRWHLFSDVGSPDARERHLLQARAAGAALRN